MASQLFLLPAALRAGDKQVPIDYLFAAATAPVYRRRGYMKLLLRYAAELSEQRGKAAIVLRPGSEELYRYYAKFGYQIAFSERVWTCTRDALQAFSEPCGAADAIPVLTAFFQQTDGVVWEKDALRYALSEYRTFRGKAAAGGQAFAAESEDGAQIIAPVSALGQGFSLLLSLSDAPAFTVTLPPDATFGTRQNSGMIRFLTDPIPIQNAFLSFAME